MHKFFITRKRALSQAGFGVLMIAGLIVLSYPFWPLAEYTLRPPTAELISPGSFPDSSESDGAEPSEAENEMEEAMAGNVLIIPKIGVRVAMIGGTNEKYALSQGAWILPGTSTPDKGSNTVLSGHRFRYKPPHEHTFYLLDKIAVGDMMQVFWEGREYRYRVFSTKIVAPNAVEVLKGTPNSILTITTCTPLFSTKERLIVSGELVGIL